VARGLYPSRARARDAIVRGAVLVEDQIEAKPARLVADDAAIVLQDAARHYVSRAALKLAHALTHFRIDVAGRSCLDIGASTGGFTQVLLDRGAAHVTAIEVGHGQLASAIAADSRVTSIEGLNARDLTAAHLTHPTEIIVGDVSFISLKLALPPALGLAPPAAVLVALVKPQFETGREAIGKGGIVADSAVHTAVCNDVAGFLCRSGWKVLGIVPSPVRGGDGNQEFLIAALKTP
jgi:23S rRNA (cytidine1920-2'-O)/16S rRNA (cytidine1409-2'-O)-methyltransferase